MSSRTSKSKPKSGESCHRIASGPSELEVCLTSNQARTLGILPGDEPIGCGASACAFPRPDNNVAKVTSDPTDVSALIEAQGIPHVAKVRAAYKLKGEGRPLRRNFDARIPIYGVIVERLDPLRTESWTQPVLDKAKEVSMDADEQGNPAEITNKWNKQKVQNLCYDQAEGGFDKTCERFAEEVLKTSRALRERGIQWLDMHVGNLGRDKGRKWKILDLGLSGHRKRLETLATLDGPRRRLHGRLRALGKQR